MNSGSSRLNPGASVLANRGDEEIGLDFNTVCWDVVAFDQAIAGGQLSEALDLYRGDLLEGFFISGALDLERWLEGERTPLRETPRLPKSTAQLVAFV